MMDVARYEFACQKALHQGLQYARSLGHQLLEVEHIALAMVRGQSAAVDTLTLPILQRHLEQHLGRSPRVYGTVKVEFGRRLDSALDLAEAAAQDALVDAGQLWSALCRQSTLLQTFFARRAAETERSDSFEPMVGAQVSGDPSLYSPGTPPAAPRVASSPAKAAEQAAQPPASPASSTSTAKGPTPANPAAKADAAKSPPKRQVDPATKAESKSDRDLRLYTVDLSSLAERDELDPVIGRDTEVRRVLEILGRKKKNNPLLIGEPGVGKSAVAEAVALRIAKGAVPETMRGKRVLTLDLGAMLAGAKFRGEFEDRMKNLLAALEDRRGQIILFIDEIHMLVGAGNQEGGADAANLLKPALARGELQCLGATTLDEFRRHIEKDPALERRFQPLLVEEPSAEVTVGILRGLKARYEIHHGVQIDDEALTAAVHLSLRYLPTRKLPDKAIDLMDEAASRLRLQIDSVPAIMAELKGEIEQCEIERQAIAPAEAGTSGALGKLAVRLDKAKGEYSRIEAHWRRHQELLARLQKAEQRRQESDSLYESAKAEADFDFAARVRYGELPQLRRESDQVKAELAALQKEHTFLRQVVGAREIAEVVGAWTRIPVGRLLEDDAGKLRSLEARLGQRVFGQDAAIRKVVRTLKRARVGINDPRRPLGVFLFLGPTGVGKTETAKALAIELFADETKIVRIDMSEFMEQHSAARLIGAPPGYVGFGEGGELTEAVRHQPYSVVLFDEIEKAHPRVLDLLLQTFEDGRLTDGKGRLVDFRHTLIIMTSNLPLPGVAEPQTATDSAVRNSLARQLRPEFVNRIDEVAVFRRLGQKHLDSLVGRLTGELNERLEERLFRISLGPHLRRSLITTGTADAFGGRAVRRAFETLVVDAVSERILGCPELAQGAWTLDGGSGRPWRWRLEQRASYYLPAARRSKS